jgi:branched-chain amino acid transport system substrate-binding protein
MRIRKLGVALALASVLTATACGGGDSGSSSSKEVTVGAVLTLTGVGADFGQAQKAAFEMGVADAEEETDTKLKVVYEDSGESNTVALSALKSVLRERPAVIYGPFLGTQVLAMAPQVSAAKVPMMVTSGTKSITEGAETDMVFRWYLSTGLSEPVTASYVTKEQGIKKAAILYDTTAYGQDGLKLLQDRFKELGVEVVAAEAINPTDKDASGQAHKIVAANPDAVFVQLIGGASGAVAIKALKGAGNTAQIVWGSGIVSHSLLDLVEDEDVDGIIGNSVAVVTDASTEPEIVDFLKRYKEKTGRDGDQFSLAAYDAGRFIATEAAEGADNPQDWAKLLEDVKYDGVLATYENDGNRNLVTQTTVLEMDGKVPTELAVIQGDSVE